LRATRDGFALRIKSDLDRTAAADPASYAMSSYTYEYHAEYGSAEMETAKVAIAGVEVVDARTVRLRADGLRTGGLGYVHELTMPGVRDASGRRLLHDVAYYTLHRLPAR